MLHSFENLILKVNVIIYYILCLSKTECPLLSFPIFLCSSHFFYTFLCHCFTSLIFSFYYSFHILAHPYTFLQLLILFLQSFLFLHSPTFYNATLFHRFPLYAQHRIINFFLLSSNIILYMCPFSFS